MENSGLRARDFEAQFPIRKHWEKFVYFGSTELKLPLRILKRYIPDQVDPVTGSEHIIGIEAIKACMNAMGHSTYTVTIPADDILSRRWIFLQTEFNNPPEAIIDDMFATGFEISPAAIEGYARKADEVRLIAYDARIPINVIAHSIRVMFEVGYSMDEIVDKMRGFGTPENRIASFSLITQALRVANADVIKQSTPESAAGAVAAVPSSWMDGRVYYTPCTPAIHSFIFNADKIGIKQWQIQFLLQLAGCHCKDKDVDKFLASIQMADSRNWYSGRWLDEWASGLAS